jgi:UDP-2-acetamido-2-deoxy-ribo-hexuluronate aminotransferase
MFIDFAGLNLQYLEYKDEIDSGIHSVLKKSNYYMGDEIVELERKLQKYTKSRYAVTCSSGTDALMISLMALGIGPGDEVITTPFTFIATAEAIALVGAVPVFVDIDSVTFNLDSTKIEKVVTSKTKAIIPVCLYGQPADLIAIQKVADAFGLKVIVDGAQSFGSYHNEKMNSRYGDIYITSFFPTKPLGCYGDGGAIFTDNFDLYNKVSAIRSHGQTERYVHKYIGITGRIDTIQAAVLLAKLPHFDSEIVKRNKIAKIYSQALSNELIKPEINRNNTSVWAQYTIKVECRSDLQEFLIERGIPTAIYYPVPLHLQECFSYLEYKKNDFPVSENISKKVLSLPINPFLNEQEVAYIVETINGFFDE